jgi:hypothetical protein
MELLSHKGALDIGLKTTHKIAIWSTVYARKGAHEIAE